MLNIYRPNDIYPPYVYVYLYVCGIYRLYWAYVFCIYNYICHFEIIFTYYESAKFAAPVFIDYLQFLLKCGYTI